MLNIHLKIEAKQLMTNKIGKPYITIFNSNRLEGLKSLYACFDTDKFLLPYKVFKLSKKARRNLLSDSEF